LVRKGPKIDVLKARKEWLKKKQKELEKQLQDNMIEQMQLDRQIKKAIAAQTPED
jgi:prefoldin subunit 5